MGTSQEAKAKSHDRIVEVAARQIRERGTTAPSVAEIMAAAGLTHGGFYKHFGSREELIGAAAERALSESGSAFGEIVEDAADPLASFVEWYVSTAHRDDPAGGCAVAALAGEGSRVDPRVRAAYRRQVESYLRNLEMLLGGEGTRHEAIVTLTSMVGALLVARAVEDEALSEEILREVRAEIIGAGAAGRPADAESTQPGTEGR